MLHNNWRIKVNIGNEELDVLISIKPVYVKEIKLGKKKYEFRKRIFKKNVRNIYIYESAPIKKIVGFFPYAGCLCDTPSKIWDSCQNHSGIDKGPFFQYYEESSIAYAIIIDDFKLWDTPLDPRTVFEKFTAPQSYMYIPKGSVER